MFVGKMKKSGASTLPLHGGKAPSWLVGRMKKLAKPIVRIIIDEFGREDFLRRLSDPYWFQSLGCVLGYDWHSSGVTTVTTGVLKDVIEPGDFGVFAAGGKGKKSTRTPSEIETVSSSLNLSHKKIENLKYASRTSAKVDNAAIQAGAPLYHHTLFGTEDGEWTVIQQGMNTDEGIARRYHWTSEGIQNFVEEPHEAIVAEEKKENVLDMTSKISKDCRSISVDLVSDSPDKVKKDLESIRPRGQKGLTEWMPNVESETQSMESFSMPERLNWSAVKKAYELQPKNFEKLLNIEGIGPATVRGLALVSEIIYGESASWKDPAKYSYAFGGKDGIPYPVNKEAMDKAHETLKAAVEEAEIGQKNKLKAIKRLEKSTPAKIEK